MRTKHEKVEATVDDLHRRMSSTGSEVTRGEDVNSSAHSLNSLGAVPADAAPATDLLQHWESSFQINPARSDSVQGFEPS